MVDQKVLLEKALLITDKLLHLGEADYESDKTTDPSKIKQGLIARDFGIKEWDWPQGVGLFGLDKLQEKLGDVRYDAFLVDWFNANFERGLPSKNINTTAPYLTLCGLAERTGNAEWRQRCVSHAEWLMTGLPKTKDGGFQHVTSAIGNRDGVQLHDGQLWVDTLFMAVLFLAKMGRLHDRADWKAMAVKQFLVHVKYLFDIHTGLFFHGWSFPRNDHFGGIFWCRGNSWFTFGVMEFIEIMGDDLDAGVREWLVDTFIAQADALRARQAEDGLWHTVLLDDESYTEVSGSAAMARGILKGVNLGILGEDYRDCAERAIQAVMANVADDGTVLNVSAGTGMGMDAEHYRKILIAPMAYGQSLALASLVEALM